MGRGRLAKAALGGDILSLTAGLRRELLQTSRGSVDLGASFDLPSQMRWEGLEGEPEDEFASRGGERRCQLNPESSHADP